MGGGIAAHLANLGFQVSLLDATSNLAQIGLDRARNAKPPRFYTSERSHEIRLGNVGDDIELAIESDWICEAIVERLEEKRALFARLDGAVRVETMVSTNTSSLPISMIGQGLSDSLRGKLIGTHFFNPPRYLQLLELIPSEATDERVVRAMTEFLESRVARRVVVAKDSPGFIANRYGMWCMFLATRLAERLQLAVEDVDAITGSFLGRPKTGTFRLNDIVGIDIMRDIAVNLIQRCPQDANIKTLEPTKSMASLLSRGWVGDKAGNGYYRREGKEILSLDLGTLAYRMQREPALPALVELGSLPLPDRLKAGLEDRSEVGEFLREYLPPILRYADSLKEEVSHSVLDFDRVMMWGFGWQMGPFAMIDAIGPGRVGLGTDGPFYRSSSFRGFDSTYHKVREDPRFRPLDSFPVIGGGGTYTLRDLGQGVVAIGLNTKMGVINPALVAELSELLQKKIDRFVLTSEARSFSAGFDLRFFQEKIASGDLSDIRQALENLQQLGEILGRHTCVAAVFGHCLGAGLELAMSCSVILADAETQIGLPESRVGLIPGGRGVALMRVFNSHSAKRLAEVAGTLTEGTVAPNADSARQYGFLRPTDRTVYSRDQLVHFAREAVLELSRPLPIAWSETVGPVAGMIDRELERLRSQGAISEYDEMIGGKIRQIMARSTGYEDALSRERDEFLDLCGRSMTQARVRHMLESGRPLRN
jgi:3-hydroxyacyl-CoA dehydrogenase